MKKIKLWIEIVLISALANNTICYDDAELEQKCEKLLPGCNCYDLKVIAGISCSNATEFFATRYLQDGSIFKINETFEIIINGGITTLPPKSVEDLIVFRLTLDNPEIDEIDERAFDGVFRLRRFHVRHSSIKKIPDFRSVQDSLQNLNFDNSLLTELVGDSLKNLSILKSVSFVNNSINLVEEDIFEGTNNIIIFDLSYNKLSSLPQHIFDSLTQLQKVVLSHNQLLHVDGLFSKIHPKFIYLDFNNITNLDTVLHPNMDNVSTLNLANNPIERVSLDSFEGKVPEVRFIYLDHCLIREFNVDYYKSLDILNELDLSYNSIDAILPQKLNFGSYLELVLVGNHIKDFQAEVGHNLQRINLANNQLSNLGKIVRFTQLSDVYVSGNELTQLRSEDFQGVNGLNVLKLQRNRIKWIDRTAFFNIRNDLQNMDLSCNLLTSLNGSMSFLSQIKFLNLSFNFLSVFEENEFTGLNELSELYLQSNHLIALGGQLQLLPQLQFLVLSNNSIRTLKRSLIPDTLQYLYLIANPIQCDCKLLPFILWLNSTNSPRTDYPLCVSSAIPIYNSTHPCPHDCECTCAKDFTGYFMSIDCSSRNLSTLPTIFTSQSMQDLQLIKIYMDNIEIEDRVGGINLSNNSLKSLEKIDLPMGLTNLYLHKNKLTKLTPEILTEFYGLRNISLSGNPWICNCESVEFRKWILSKADIINDVNQTRCGNSSESVESKLNNKVILTLDERDLCPTSLSFYLSLGIGILVVCMGITFFTITYTRYEISIRIWLFAHGITWVKEKDFDRDKEYDAFISFSYDDFDLVVNEIISVIEKREPKIRTFLFYKHFKAGQYIPDNINYAITNSKRTVIVLSKNFLKSEWCLLEFKTAHEQLLKDKVNRIIIIKLGALPDLGDHPEIQTHMKNNIYLTWGENNFWYKLFYALPYYDQQNSTTIGTVKRDFESSTSQLI